MVSRLIGSVIANILNDKIEDLDSNQLNVSLLSGNLELRDLKIRQSILDEVNLPVVLLKGIIGKISVSVPWLSISTQPSVFTIDDFSKESFRDAEQRDKNAKLRKYEEVKELERSGRPEFSKGTAVQSKEGDSLTAKLLQVVLRNIQVCVNRIHFRFEDVAPETGAVYAFGFVLEGLRVSSSSSSSSSGSASDSTENNSPNVLRKSVDLRSLAVYIDPHVELPLSKSRTDKGSVFVDAMKGAVSYTTQGAGKRVHPLKELCVLGPIDAKAELAVTSGFGRVDLTVPMCSVECVFPSVDLSLSEPQFHVAAALSDLVVQYGKTIGNLQYRPKVPVMENPRAWFQYAGKAIIREVAERRRRTSFKYLIQRAHIKARYIELFKRYRQVRWLKPLSEPERDELNDMERDLPVQDIIFFRTIADNILDKEALLNFKVEEQKPQQEAQKPVEKKNNNSSGGGGWFSWLWWAGSSSSSSSAKQQQQQQPVTEDNEDVKLSKEELEEVTRLVGYKEAYDAISPPPEYVKMSVLLRVNNVRVALRSAAPYRDILVLNLGNVLTSLALREANMALQLCVDTISAEDLVTENTKFPHILSSSSSSSSSSSNVGSNSNSSADSSEHFIDLCVEISPLDKHADSVIAFKMKSANVVLPHKLFKRLSAFFTPTTHISVTALKKLTTDKLWNLIEASKVQLERVVQEHKVIDLNVCIESPTLVMPQNPERDNSSLLVLDLGKLVMVSCKKEEEHKMYDKYTMNLVDFSLSIQGSNSSSSPSGIIASQQQEKIVEKFSLSVDIFSSIVPNELTIPTLVVSSEISSAKVNVSIQSLLALNRYRELFLPERDSASPAAHSGDDETYDEQAAIEYKQLTIEQITKAQNDLDEVERLSKEHVNKREAFLKALAEHKVVDAVFKVGDADLALLDETGVPIADFRVKDTALLYTGRTFSTTVDLTVGAISIGNTLFYREKRDLPYLGTSSKSGDGKKVCAFATVHFESFEKGTPVYKKVDNDLRVEFNYFYLIVVPEVFTKILKFANYIKEERKQREKESGQLAATTGGSKSTGSSKQIRSQKNDYVKVNFGLDVGTLGIIFVDEQTTQRIAEFSVTGMNADVTVKENGAAKVLFELRSLAVQDLAAADSNRKGVDGTLAGTPNPLYERIVAPQDPSKVVVRAEVTTNLLLDDGWAGENEVGSSASLTLEPLCFVLMPSFIRELKNYFTRTIFFQALKKSEFLKMEKALVEREIDPTRKQSKSLFRVVIKAPKFILPKNYSSKDYLIVSFSAITAQNNYYLNSTASSSTTALPQPLPPASTISNCGCESGALNAISSSSSSSAINSSAISMACVASEFHVDGELLERTDVLFSGASAATSLGGAFCSITEGVSFDIGMTKSGNSQYNVFPVSCICLDFKPIALALSSEQFEFLVTFALNDIVVPNFDWVFFFLDFMELYGLSKPSKRQRIELAFSEISADFKKHYFDLPFARLVVRDLGVSVLGMLNGKLRTEFLINYLKLRAVKDEKSGYRMDDCIDLHNIVKVAVELEDVPATDPAFCNSGNNNCGNSSDGGGGSTTTDNNNTVSSGGASKESFLSNVVTIVTVEVEIVEVIVHILSLDFVSEFYLGFLVKNLALLHFDPNAASDLDGNGYRESSKAVVRVNASLKNSEIYAPTDEQQNVLMISGEVFTLEIDTARMYAVVKSKNSFAMINDKKVIEPFDCARFEFQFVDDVVLNVALDIGDLTGASPVGGLTLIASFIRFIFSLLLILFNPFSAHSPDEESDSDITFTCNIPRLKFFVTYDNDNSYESQFCLLRAAGSRVTIRDLVKSVGAPGSLEREVNTTFTVDFATEAQVDFFNQAFAWFEPILEPTRFQVNYDERDHVAPLKNNVVNRYAVAFSADSKMRLNVTIPFVRGIERIYLSLIGAELDPDVRDSFLLGSAGSSIGLNDNPYTKMLKAAAGKGGANAALAGEKLTEEEAFLLSSYEDIDHKKGESKTVILNKTGYPLAGYFFYEKILPEASAAAAAAASVVSFSTYSKGNASTLLRPSLSPSLSTSSSSSSSRLSRGSNDGNDSDDSEEDMTRREKFMIEPYTGWNPYFVSFGNNTRAKPFSLFRRQTNNILRVARMTFKGADLPSFNLCLDKAGTTLHRVPGIDPIVTEVKWVEEYKCKIVTIRSCLQIVNNTNYQLDAILTSSLHPELPPHVMKLKPDVVKSVPIGFSVESKVRIAIHKSQLYGQSLEAIRTSDILTGERFAYTCLPYDPSAPTPPLYFCAYGKKFAMNALTAVSSSSSSSSSSTGSPLSPSLSSPPNIPLNKQQHHHHHQQQQQQQQQQQPVPVQPSHPISEAASQYYQGLQQLGLSTRTFIGTIVIVPPIVVTNTIPHQCSFTASQLASGRAKKGVIRFVLEKGESTGLCNFDPRTAIALSITHIGSSTVSNIAFQAYTATQGTYLVEARTPNDALMPVQVSMVAKRIPVRTYTFGVPYWIVNKTGIKLSYGYNRMESISVALGDTEERPVIFSNDVLCIRTYSPQRQGKWTKDIPLKDPDPKDIELRSPDDTVQYAVRIVSVPGKKPYERSRVVTISPRYVFVNRIRGCVVSFKQSTLPDKAKVSLGYNEYKDYHWNAKAPSRSFVNFIKDSFDRSFLVSLRPAPGASTRSANTTNSSEEAAVTSVSVEYPWAGPFEIGACGEYTIRMVGPDSTDYFLRYEVVDAKYSTFVLFKEMKDIFVPYKIENSSGYQIYAYQEASSSEPLGQVVVDNNATRNFGWIRPLAKRVLAVRFPVSPPLVVRYNPNKVVRFEKIRIEGRPPIYNYMRVAGYTRVLVLTTDRAKYLAEGKFLGLDSGMFSGTASSFFNGRRIGSAAIIALPFLSDENAKKKKKELAASAYADGNEGSNRKRSSSRASTAGRELVSFSSDNADSGVEGDDGVVEDYDSMYAAALGNSCDVDGDNDGSNANESAPEGNCEDSDNDSNYGNGYITRLREEQEAEDAKREIRMRAKRPPPEGGRCEPDEICSVRIDVAVQSVEASIVTPEPRELAVLTLLGLSCKSEITASTLTTEVSVGYIQLDDQNFESVYPVPLVGLPAKETGHWMVAEVVRSRLHDAIDYYKYFSLSVAPLNVRLNVDFALRMYSYFCALEPEIFTMRKSSISSGGNGGSNSNKEGKEEDDDPKAKLTPWEAENENICKNRDVINDRMLYFQVFRLDPLKVYISLSSKWSSDADFLHNYLVEAALKLLENIENVPYDFNPVFFRNFFSAKSKFALVICYGYLTQILKHPGKLLGYSGSAGNASFIRETFGYGFEEVFRSTPTDADPEALESVRPCLYSQEGSSSATVAAADGAASAEPSSTPTSASSSFSALPALTEVSPEVRSRSSSAAVRPVRPFATAASMPSVWRLPLPDNLVRIPDKSLLVSRVHFYPRVFGMGGRLIRYQEVVFKLMYTIKELKNDVCVWNKVFSKTTTDSSTSTSEDEIASGPKRRKATLVCFITDKRFVFYEVGDKTRMDIISLDHATWALNKSTVYYIDEKDASVHTYDLLEPSVASEAFAVIKALNVAKLSKITPPGSPTSPIAGPYSQPSVSSSSVVSTIIAY